MPNLFTKIIQGDIPSHKITENAVNERMARELHIGRYVMALEFTLVLKSPADKVIYKTIVPFGQFEQAIIQVQLSPKGHEFVMSWVVKVISHKPTFRIGFSPTQI